MTMRQDSSDPTGVKDLTPRGNGDVARARLRKARAAVALRKKGHSWDEIAEIIGFPTGRMALVATERALEVDLQNPESQAFMRNLASKRLDSLLKGVWGKATDDTNPEHLAAVGVARGIVGDMVKLHGLQAPTEHVITNPTQGEIETFVAQLIHRSQPQLEEANIFDIEVVEETGCRSD